MTEVNALLAEYRKLLTKILSAGNAEDAVKLAKNGFGAVVGKEVELFNQVYGASNPIRDVVLVAILETCLAGIRARHEGDSSFWDMVTSIKGQLMGVNLGGLKRE